MNQASRTDPFLRRRKVHRPYWPSIVLPAIVVLLPLPGPARANTFGQDARVPLNDEEVASFPYHSVGKLFTSTGSCTASLVGPGLILTAGHCAGSSAVFYPAYHDGQAPFGSAQVTEWHKGSGDGAGDWALGTLDHDLGTELGWFGVRPYYSRDHQHWSVMQLPGYPGDRYEGDRMTIHRGCKIIFEQYGVLWHCCDAAPGSSGAPILYRDAAQHWYVLGVHTSQSNGGSSSCASSPNYAVPSGTFLPTLQRLVDSSSISVIYASTYPYGIGFEVDGARYEFKPGQRIDVDLSGQTSTIAIWECPAGQCRWSQFAIHAGGVYRIVDWGSGGLRLSE